MEQRPKRLLDQACTELVESIRDVIRIKHYSIRTEQAYVDWIKRYILFNNKRHPKEMGSREIEAFLTYLAVEQNVAASTQNPSTEPAEVRLSVRCCSCIVTCLKKTWKARLIPFALKSPSACPPY